MAEQLQQPILLCVCVCVWLCLRVFMNNALIKSKLFLCLCARVCISIVNLESVNVESAVDQARQEALHPNQSINQIEKKKIKTSCVCHLGEFLFQL